LWMLGRRRGRCAVGTNKGGFFWTRFFRTFVTPHADCSDLPQRYLRLGFSSGSGVRVAGPDVLRSCPEYLRKDHVDACSGVCFSEVRDRHDEGISPVCAPLCDTFRGPATLRSRRFSWPRSPTRRRPRRSPRPSSSGSAPVRRPNGRRRCQIGPGEGTRLPPESPSG